MWKHGMPKSIVEVAEASLALLPTESMAEGVVVAIPTLSPEASTTNKLVTVSPSPNKVYVRSALVITMNYAGAFYL